MASPNADLALRAFLQIERRVWHVAEIRDGRIARVEVYFDEHEARRVIVAAPEAAERQNPGPTRTTRE